MFSKRGDYTDFRVRAKVKIGPGANSGLLFRMPYTDELKTGYEAQIEDRPADRYPTGSLHGLASFTRGLVPADKWFTLEVIAAGPRIRILVDGKQTVDYTDTGAVFAAGVFPLQQWVPGREVRFGKIEIQELPCPSSSMANPSGRRIVGATAQINFRPRQTEKAPTCSRPAPSGRAGYHIEKARWAGATVAVTRFT